MPATAQSDQPRAVLILAPGISAEAFFEEFATARWTQVRKEAAAALVSAAVPGPDNAGSGYVTIGAGRRLPDLGYGLPGGDLVKAILLHEYEQRPGTAFMAAAPVPGSIVVCSGPPATLAGAWAPGSQMAILQLPAGQEPARILEAFQSVAQGMHSRRDLVILCSADPDQAAGGQFQHLAPALFWGKGWSAGTAVSATTRTRGLISNTDVMPTLLAHLGYPFPTATEGHVAQPAPGSVAELIALERHTRAVGALTIPVLIGWGVFAFLGVAFGLFLARGRPSPRQVLVARGLVAAAVSVPVAMLLAGWMLAVTEVQLVGTVVALTVLLGGVALLFQSVITPLRCVFALLVGVVLLDLATGGRLLSRCLLGDFVNTGVRFYGIGNEYEGLVLGAATLVPFLEDRETKALRPQWVAFVVWPVVLLFVAAPGLGADFGGALSLGLAFAAGLWLPARRRFHVRQVAAAVLFLVILAVGVVALDLARPAGSRSHVGELAAQALSGNLGRVGEVVGRKLLMNLRMTATPYALAGLAAVAALGGFCYHMLAFRLKAALAARPLLRAGSCAALLGAAAAFLLNDSGIVAGALAAGCVLVVWLDMMLVDAAAAEPTNSPA